METILLLNLPPRNRGQSLPRNLEAYSMATIGASSKGPVSERKRIRAAGRAWLNFSRLEFLEIGHRIRVQHVRSHGSQSVEQVGNDNADRLANKFRIQGELSKPTLYLWESEESLLFQHQNKNVQGDPRTYLKNLEKELMSKIWKEKLRNKPNGSRCIPPKSSSNQNKFGNGQWKAGRGMPGYTTSSLSANGSQQITE
jgi:hypothetical protein